MAIPSRIQENLYLGSMQSANNLKALRSLGITHILTICPIRPVRDPSIIYKHVSLPDSPTARIDVRFEECYTFIQEALSQGGKVLIHCFGGVSRSATITVFYIMRSRNLGFEEAMGVVRAKRSINPNFGFVNQLRNYPMD